MFQVRWIQTAQDELATIWMKADSPSRRDITAASHSIDKELQINPETKGESRQESERVYFAHPLGVLYEMDTAASTVWILHVWIILRDR